MYVFCGKKKKKTRYDYLYVYNEIIQIIIPYNDKCNICPPPAERSGKEKEERFIER